MPAAHHILRAVAPALFGALSLLTGASAMRTGSQSGSTALVMHTSGVFHPGYHAQHTTRLIRWDHRGLGSMLEEGATNVSRFERLGKVVRDRHAGRPGPSGGGFLQMSEAQVEALDKHHGEIRQMQVERSEKENSREGQDMAWAISAATSTPLVLKSSQYIGVIQIGTKYKDKGCPTNGASTVAGCADEPLTSLFTVFDTGSTNFWVFSEGCTDTPCIAEGRRRFDGAKSSSFHPPNSSTSMIRITFGTGGISGRQAVEDMRIGPFTVLDQTIGLIYKAQGAVFEEVPIEGIIGLAFPAMSTNGVVPFFDSVMNQKILAQQEFAFYFSEDNPEANILLWGGVHPGLYEEPIEFFPVSDPYYWSIDLAQMRLGNDVYLSPVSHAKVQDSLRDKGWTYPKAIVDTGTSFLTAESYLIESLLARLPSMPCTLMTSSSHPDLHLDLVNAVGAIKTLSLTREEYMTSSGRGDMCTPAFMRIDVPHAHNPAIVLGEVWSRKYFSVFYRGADPSRPAMVGFGRARHDDYAKRVIEQLSTEHPVHPTP